jgi:hypothetical protein
MAKNPRLCVSAWERSPLEFSEVIGSRGVGLSHLIYWHGEELKPPSIDAEIIGTSSLACVVSARHPFARLEEVPLLSLENEPLALPWLPRDTRDLAGYIRPYFGAHKLAPRRVVYQGREVTALLDIVRAGHAVTVLPFAEDSDGHGLVAVKLAPTPPRRHIALMRKPGTAWSQTAQAFATEMRKRFPAFDPTSVSFVPREWAPSDEKKRDDTPSVAESVANATRDAALTQLAVERKVRDAKS